MPEGDENSELKDAQFRQAERATADCPGAAIRFGDAIEQICTRENLQILDSPFNRMPPSSLQRADKSFNKFMFQLLHYCVCNQFTGSSGANLPCSGTGPRRIVYSSDKEDDAPSRQPPFGYPPPEINESDSYEHWPARNPEHQARRTGQSKQKPVWINTRVPTNTTGMPATWTDLFWIIIFF